MDQNVARLGCHRDGYVGETSVYVGAPEALQRHLFGKSLAEKPVAIRLFLRANLNRKRFLADAIELQVRNLPFRLSSNHIRAARPLRKLLLSPPNEVLREQTLRNPAENPLLDSRGAPALPVP